MHWYFDKINIKDGLFLIKRTEIDWFSPPFLQMHVKCIRFSHRLISTLVKCQHTNMSAVVAHKASKKKIFHISEHEHRKQRKIDIVGGCYAMHCYVVQAVCVNISLCAMWMPLIIAVTPSLHLGHVQMCWFFPCSFIHWIHEWNQLLLLESGKCAWSVDYHSHYRFHFVVHYLCLSTNKTSREHILQLQMPVTCSLQCGVFFLSQLNNGNTTSGMEINFLFCFAFLNAQFDKK